MTTPLIFYNPHVDDFLAEPPHFQLLGRKALKKYQHLLRGILKQQGQVPVFADARVSAYIPDWLGFARWPGWIRRLITRLELKRWAQINQLEGKIHLLDASQDFSHSVLFGFSYKACRLGEALQDSLRPFPLKLMHLSHIHLSTQKKSQSLRSLTGVRLCGDADLSSSPYFQHFFDWYRDPFVLVPFAVESRFQSQTPFLEREPKALATGTIHDVRAEKNTEDYQSFFPHPSFHPLRTEIYARSSELQPYVDSRISPFRGRPESFGQKLLNRFSSTQKSYFKIDLVQLYNSYRYVVIGEEAVGFPGLGAFEAMACGCLLLASPTHYQGLGLIPGEHYMAHDGTADSVVAAIQYLNAQPDQARQIAERGRLLVAAHFNQSQAFQDFMTRLSKFVLQPQENQP